LPGRAAARREAEEVALVIGSALALILAAIAAMPFAPQERMQFAITYIGLPMGKARLSVGKREGELLPILLEARTSGIVGLITLREQLASYVDVTTGLPRVSSQDEMESDYRHTNYTRYDRAAGTATVREKGKKSEKTTELEVPPGTLDFVALLFRLRTLPLDPGARHEFHVLTGSHVSRVVAEVVGRETVETHAGTFPAVKVSVPTGFDGKFSENSPTLVWFSDDARRIVVRISTDFAIGRALADLVSYEPGAAAAAGD
jgi:hypothetical protein